MRKNLLLLLFTGALILLIGCSGDSIDTSSDGGMESDTETSSGEKVTLILNNIAPSTHHLAVNALEPWIEYVDEKTEGRLIIEVYHGGALGDAPTAYDDIAGGAYDIGFAPSDYVENTTLFPWTISDLPFVFSDPIITSEVVSQVMDEFAIDKLNENIVHLGTAGLDPSMIISVAPINSAEEIKNLQIAASSKSVTDLISAWGATPVALPFSETYESLQRKTADAVVYTGAGSVGMSFYEVAPNYVEDVHPTTGTLPLLINKNALENMPEDLKEQFVNDLAPYLIDLMNESYVNEMNKFKEDLSAKGVNFIKLPEEDVKSLLQPGKEIWDKWIETANERGYDGQAIVDRTIELLEENGISVDFLK